MNAPRRLAGAAALAVALAAGARAEPPPGHPTPGQAGRLLGLPGAPAAAALPYTATVLTAIDANQYTYLEVLEEGRSRWIAAPRIAARPGATVRFGDGRLMTGFYSRKLGRLFETLTFVPPVVIDAPDGQQ